MAVFLFPECEGIGSTAVVALQTSLNPPFPLSAFKVWPVSLVSLLKEVSLGLMNNLGDLWAASPP